MMWQKKLIDEYIFLQQQENIVENKTDTAGIAVSVFRLKFNYRSTFFDVRKNRYNSFYREMFIYDDFFI